MYLNPNFKREFENLICGTLQICLIKKAFVGKEEIYTNHHIKTCWYKIRLILSKKMNGPQKLLYFVN